MSKKKGKEDKEARKVFVLGIFGGEDCLRKHLAQQMHEARIRSGLSVGAFNKILREIESEYVFPSCSKFETDPKLITNEIVIGANNITGCYLTTLCGQKKLKKFLESPSERAEALKLFPEWNVSFLLELFICMEALDQLEHSEKKPKTPEENGRFKKTMTAARVRLKKMLIPFS